MNKPYWNILIKRLKADKTITTGVTIPYLYGAYRILGFQHNSIHDLLNLILDSRSQDFPVIERCDVILHDVVKLEEKNIANRNRRNEFKLSNRKTENSIFVSYNCNLGNTDKKVIAGLITKYQTQIDNEQFSWNNKGGIWREFNQLEIDVIAGIK